MLCRLGSIVAGYSSDVVVLDILMGCVIGHRISILRTIFLLNYWTKNCSLRNNKKYMFIQSTVWLLSCCCCCCCQLYVPNEEQPLADALIDACCSTFAGEGYRLDVYSSIPTLFGTLFYDPSNRSSILHMSAVVWIYRMKYSTILCIWISTCVYI